MSCCSCAKSMTSTRASGSCVTTNAVTTAARTRPTGRTRRQISRVFPLCAVVMQDTPLQQGVCLHHGEMPGHYKGQTAPTCLISVRRSMLRKKDAFPRTREPACRSWNGAALTLCRLLPWPGVPHVLAPQVEQLRGRLGITQTVPRDLHVLAGCVQGGDIAPIHLTLRLLHSERIAPDLKGEAAPKRPKPRELVHEVHMLVAVTIGHEVDGRTHTIGRRAYQEEGAVEAAPVERNDLLRPAGRFPEVYQQLLLGAGDKHHLLLTDGLHPPIRSLEVDGRVVLFGRVERNAGYLCRNGDEAQSIPDF